MRRCVAVRSCRCALVKRSALVRLRYLLRRSTIRCGGFDGCIPGGRSTCASDAGSIPVVLVPRNGGLRLFESFCGCRPSTSVAMGRRRLRLRRRTRTAGPPFVDGGSFEPEPVHTGWMRQSGQVCLGRSSSALAACARASSSGPGVPSSAEASSPSCTVRLPIVRCTSQTPAGPSVRRSPGHLRVACRLEHRRARRGIEAGEQRDRDDAAVGELDAAAEEARQLGARQRDEAVAVREPGGVAVDVAAGAAELGRTCSGARVLDVLDRECAESRHAARRMPRDSALLAIELELDAASLAGELGEARGAAGARRTPPCPHRPAERSRASSRGTRSRRCGCARRCARAARGCGRADRSRTACSCCSDHDGSSPNVDAFCRRRHDHRPGMSIHHVNSQAVRADRPDAS